MPGVLSLASRTLCSMPGILPLVSGTLYVHCQAYYPLAVIVFHTCLYVLSSLKCVVGSRVARCQRCQHAIPVQYECLYLLTAIHGLPRIFSGKKSLDGAISLGSSVDI